MPLGGEAIRRYLISGGVWALTGRILTALLGVGLSAILARILTTEAMGAYFLAFNLATFFAIFGRMGLENTLVRFVSEALAREEPALAREIIKTGLLISLGGSAAVGCIVYAGIGRWLSERLFNSELLVASLGWVAVWLTVIALQVLFGGVFRALQDMRAATIFGGLCTLSVSVALLVWQWMLVGHATLPEVLGPLLAAGAINAIAATYVLWLKVRDFPAISARPGLAPNLLSHSWPLLINGITLFMTAQADLWILAAYRPDAEVAVYGAASRLVLLTGMALAIVNAVVPPLIARFNARSERGHLEQLLRGAATIAAMPALALLVPFLLWGDEILEVIFGGSYADGARVLAVLSIGRIVSVLVGCCGNALIMMGYRRTVMAINVATASLGLVVAVSLVQLFGKEGVAIAMCIATILQQVLTLHFAKRQCGIWTHIDIPRLPAILRAAVRRGQAR